jgi:hypothetical protein
LTRKDSRVSGGTADAKRPRSGLAAGLFGGLALGMIAGAAAYPGDGYWGWGGRPSYGYYGAAYPAFGYRCGC